MSLDIYLEIPGKKHSVPQAIYIREDGHNKEISREEWDRRFPDRGPISVVAHEVDYVWTGNITHNLGAMAKEAHLYDFLWGPDVDTARELIEPLRIGLIFLKAHPDEFKKFSPENGWGTYENLVEFVEDYLEACRKYPEAQVRVSR